MSCTKVFNQFRIIHVCCYAGQCEAVTHDQGATPGKLCYSNHTYLHIMRRYSYHTLYAIKKVESGDDLKNNDDDDNDSEAERCKNKSLHHRHLPLQILEAEEMSRHIFQHYPSFPPLGTYPPFPLHPPSYHTVPVMMPVPIKTETTEFTFLQKPEQNTEDKGKHEKHDEHDEHHHDKHDHSNNHGIMTNTTFFLPCCHCQVVKTTTHTYSYNYLHSREEGMKEKAGENSKKMMVDKRNIVFQKKE